MALHDAYVKGFCKAANDAGVDPESLVKFAKDKDFFSSIMTAYQNLDPITRRAIIASLISGIGTYAFSNGNRGGRLLKGLAGASLGGLGMYGLESSGLLDKGMKYINNLAN